MVGQIYRRSGPKIRSEQGWDGAAPGRRLKILLCWFYKYLGPYGPGRARLRCIELSGDRDSAIYSALCPRRLSISFVS